MKYKLFPSTLAQNGKDKVLEQLAETVFFVQKDLQKWRSRADVNNPRECLTALRYLDSGADCWVFQTYSRLKSAGYDVEIVEEFVPGRICIAHYDHLRRRPDYNSYIVSVKADRDRTFTCHSEIIQSPYSKEIDNNYFIPHWPQPSLIQRDEKRANNITNVGYFGESKYIPNRFKSKMFLEKLANLGIHFRVIDEKSLWNDYSDIDVVFAIRDGAPYYLASKPASKLVNAWLAGCPAIVGSEPVFSYYKRSNQDFIEASSVEDVLIALQTLKDNPAKYQEMRDNAKNRALEFSSQIIENSWVETINKRIVPDFVEWRKCSSMNKKLFMLIQVIRKKIRGHLCDVGYDQSLGIPRDRTRWSRKLLWRLFDDFAFNEYKKRQKFFDSR